MRTRSLGGGEELLLWKLLESCIPARDVAQVHPKLLKKGLLHAPSSSFAPKLVSLYGELESLRAARKLFDEISDRSAILWNGLLRSHCRAGEWADVLHLFRSMVTGTGPDEFTLPIALRACAGLSALQHGKALHGYVVKSKREVIRSDVFVGTALVEMYSTGGEMTSAVKVFETYTRPDVALWTSVVTGYQQNGRAEEALLFFSRVLMENEYLIPSPISLVSLVSAITSLGSLACGKCCHGYTFRRGFECDLPLANSLLNMYTKLGGVEQVKKMFAAMSRKDVITWSCMVSFYAQKGSTKEALDHYKRMSHAGLLPNSVTVIGILQACALVSDLQEGKKIHEYAILKGFELEVAVATALIDMYMKCSCLKEAEDLFSRMPRKDVVSWAALINGYTHNGLPVQSLMVFSRMLSTGTSPDAVTMVKVLAACSQLGGIRQALCVHGFLIRGGFDQKTFIGAALVDMYSRCGSLEDAIQVFESTREKDVVLWSSMISGYGIHGLGNNAVLSFKQMLKSSVKPNHISFVSLLSACSHSGLIDDGKKIFSDMICTYGVVPGMEHYSAMVDLLGRSGELSEAFELIKQMPIPAGPHVWGAFLAGCRIHGNIEMGELAARTLF
ncbi:hypothetical protein Taro_056576, partial [Colocasia esculenta]|nr:hypothetical protein [Colocasia esculenta]